MKDRIIEQLKNVGHGYELDKLPKALLNAVVESSLPIIVKDIRKAEDRSIQKTINEKFVAKVLKATLEQKTQKRTRSTRTPIEIAKD